jgi:serine/threonine-protein kinase HipA
VWLPGATDPVVAGRIEGYGSTIDFNYGRSYLDREGAISLYEPELPLRTGRIRPRAGLTIAGCLDDAGPDSWGQRIILHRLGLDARGDTTALDPVTYFLESGSNRIGALDFQQSATDYEPRSGGGTLEEMVDAAARFDAGEEFSADLHRALQGGTSLGGARPKVLLDGGNCQYIAKLSRPNDPYPVVKAEAVAMDLARRVGLDVANTSVIEVLGHDVLLVERFDRTPAGARKMMVSAKTILEADDWGALTAGYWQLADQIRARFTDVDDALRELFSRIVFNVCVSNTDDHVRNHAAFWDGQLLTLTPAYDICPQLRTGEEQQQAMAIHPSGWRLSQLAGCLDAAPVYHLSEDEARDIIENQLTVISEQWNDAADAARLTDEERAQMRRTQILNRYITYGWT